MSVPRVKICGLTHPDDVDAAIDAGADALGVVVDVPIDTPREISAQTAAHLVQSVPPFVTTVLVTMADTPADVAALTDLTGVDAVQVHGDLTDALPQLTTAVDVPVITAVDTTNTTAVETAATQAAAVLVDATDDTGAGGTGTTTDWTTAATLTTSIDVPLILAGGLTPDNVGAAVDTVTPYAVDVASGVEATGGRKDHDAVQTFIQNATTTEEMG